MAVSAAQAGNDMIVKNGEIYQNIFKCPICGNTFMCNDRTNWAYKAGEYSNNQQLLCSWHCLREHEKAKEKHRKYQCPTRRRKVR